MQPHAKFIITLADPVRRHYSDYYFLQDNRKVYRPGEEDSSKSSHDLDTRSEAQVADFRACVSAEIERMKEGVSSSNPKDGSGTFEAYDMKDYEEGGAVWFRASQV
jgi:hypothetical protein